MPPDVRIRTVLARGLRRRCPRCGEGRLFRRWITTYETCSACGLVYQRNHGDTWLFWIIGDRVPIAIAIVAVYFGFKPQTVLGGIAAVCAMVVPLVVTMPYRQGLAIAIDYLSREYMPE